nr:MAG TPA_asm: hypothetical protein [Caudoviricetes sp.]
MYFTNWHFWRGKIVLCKRASQTSALAECSAGVFFMQKTKEVKALW